MVATGAYTTIRRDPCQTPICELAVFGGQARERRRLEEMPAADDERAYDISVFAREHLVDCGVGFSEREEGLLAQVAETAALSKTDGDLDVGLVLRGRGEAGRAPTLQWDATIP